MARFHFTSDSLAAVLNILLIRHGETDWNRHNRWQGWIDPPLNATGVAQAEAGAAALAALDLRRVHLHASDLQRAAATAEIIGATLGVEPRSNSAFRERHGGAFEGLDRAEIEARHPGALDAWHNGRLAAPPGGETDDDLRQRFIAGLQPVIDTTGQGSTIVVVTHGGAMRVLARGRRGEAGSIPNLGGRWFDWNAGQMNAGPVLQPPAVSQHPPRQRKA